jgi:hypothetical protein
MDEDAAIQDTLLTPFTEFIRDCGDIDEGTWINSYVEVGFLAINRVASTCH